MNGRWASGIVAAIVLALSAGQPAVATTWYDVIERYDVKQYQWLHYNTQNCGGATYYQITKWQFRWYRSDSVNRHVTYRGKAGAVGVDCQGNGVNRTMGPDLGPDEWLVACFYSCSGSHYYSAVSTYNASWPYTRANSWVGSWVHGRIRDRNGTTLGYICQYRVLSGLAQPC